MPIAFLHTSPVHVPTFTSLLRELAPNERASHTVDESLLVEARRLGASETSVIHSVQEAMRMTAAQNSADVVVCTCSTIGGIAETMDHGNRFIPMRVDRAMADAAVTGGASILVVAALESTLAQTSALIEDSARRQERHVGVSLVSIPEAWGHFEAGDVQAYIAAIASGVKGSLNGHDVVVLAQASMAQAAELLANLGVPVLCSPRLGVQAAIQAHASRGAA